MAYQHESGSVDLTDSGGVRAQLDLLNETRTVESLFDERRSSAEIVSYPVGGVIRPSPVGGNFKRGFDIAVASLIALLSAPLLLAIVILCKVGSRGPLLFGHKRVGFRGAEFNCLKFRTMVVDAEDRLADYLAANRDAAAEWARDRKLRNDPRITPIGHFLRKTSLDELPQLLNVLRGEMSLVGPRPVVADELNLYGARRAAYLSSRPGMTGLWQVSGRNSTTYERRTELDERYVNSWTITGDLGIILKTLPEMLLSSRTS